MDLKRGVFCVLVAERHRDPDGRKEHETYTEELREYDFHTLELKHSIPVSWGGRSYRPGAYSPDGKTLYIVQEYQFVTDPDKLLPGMAFAALDAGDGRLIRSIPLNRGGQMSCAQP